MSITFRTIQSINGKNKKILLKEFKFKNITEAKKFYKSKYNNSLKTDELYNVLKNEYNNIIETLRNDKIKLIKEKKTLIKELTPIDTKVKPIQFSLKRENRGSKKPYRVVISLEIKYCTLDNPNYEDMHWATEIINTSNLFQKKEKQDKTEWEMEDYVNNNPLIIYGNNPQDIKKEVDNIVKLKYNQIWDSYGENLRTGKNIFATPHLEKLIGKSYAYVIESIDEIHFLIKTSYSATLPRKKVKSNLLDRPMRLALPYSACFLKHFNNIDECSYVNNNGECVLKTIHDVLNRNEGHQVFSLSFLRKQFNEASLVLYKREYKKKHGITSSMLLYVCRKMNISLLGYDDNNKQFVRFTPIQGKRMYKAIVYQMAMNHFYIITDKSIVKSLTTISCNFAKDALPIDDDKVEEKQYFYDVKDYDELPHNSVSITNESLDDILKDLIKKQIIPIVKYEGLATIKEIRLKYCDKIKLDNKKQSRTISITKPFMKEMSLDTLRQICEKTNIPFKNQNIGGLLNDLSNKYFKPKREIINSDIRINILNEQNKKCNVCKTELGDKYELDHIHPVAGGGNNDRINLQILCIPCHKEKCSEEYSEYIRRDEFSSCLNIEATKILHSKFSRKVAFSNYINDEWKNLEEEDEGIQSIDINGCRKNIALYSHYNFYKYSVLDSWECFDGEIKDGNYYIETENYGLFHKNGIYSRPIVEYGLEVGIINMDDIKRQFIPSLFVDKDKLCGFIEYIWETFKDTQYQKLAVNSWVGLLGRRDNRFIQNDYAMKDDKDKLGDIYTKYNNPYINDYGDVVIITNEQPIKKLETNFYIHSQILDIEAVELHKLLTKIKSVGGKPICVKTDCVVFHHEQKNAVSIENEYWDDNKKVLKYKYEKEPLLLMKDVLCPCENKLSFDDNNYIHYDEYTIYKDADYTHIVNELIKSNKGCLLLGPAGTGKSYLVNKMFSILENNGKKILKLAPTNKSARIINGMTLDKYCYGFLKNNKLVNSYDYILVDEISMVRETFYQVLIMLKYSNPNVKIILSGDFEQLPVVKDRIQNRSYENSRVLYELVDGIKLELTKCKRSDDELFNICRDVKEGKKIDMNIFNKDKKGSLNICHTNEARKNKNNHTMHEYLKIDESKKLEIDKKCWLNICYTNKARKNINNNMMNEYLKINNGRRLEIKKLAYDDNTQDYYLVKGMPLIARKNKKSLNVFNNEMFTCMKIKKDTIILKNELNEEIEVPHNEIRYLFNLGFCITCHKSQGATFTGEYAIYEWELMSRPLRYVALSRATNINNIYIKYNGATI